MKTKLLFIPTLLLTVAAPALLKFPLMEVKADEFFDADEPTDYAYSFVALGDIQIINSQYHNQLHCLFDYVIENSELRNTKFVFGLGDSTDKDSGDEWRLAKEQFHRLDNITNWNVVRGNHDSETGFNTFFKPEDLVGNYTGCYQNTCRDMYQVLKIGNLKYLMMSLDCGPSDEELEWANDIISLYSDYNVIISTHAYLESSMKREDENSNVRATRYGGYNNGVDMWEKCFKKHANIVGILCGHEDVNGPKYNEVYGENGNKVIEMIIDPQGLDVDTNYAPTGMVNTFYISEDGSSVFVDNYSSIHEKYLFEEHQVTFNPNVIEATDPVHTYGDWRVVVEPTEKKDGYEIRECKLCGECEHRKVQYGE